MLKSMTGFSKAEASENGVSINLEIKSLNGKNLDINCRMPRTLSDKELEIRNIVRQKVTRGSVQIYINVDYEESESTFGFDLDQAQNVYKEIQELKKKLRIRDAIKLDNVLAYSNNYMSKEVLDKSETEWKLVSKSLRYALNELDKMRKKEASNISKDIMKRLNMFQDHVTKIEKLGFERIPQEQDKYKEKIARMFENDEIDEQRLQTEIVLMADKLDISEECTRLKSHIQLFIDTTRAKTSQGRKLNFIIQEMHREINTIGSKAQNTKISHMVVNLKEELERLREQVQNIE